MLSMMLPIVHAEAEVYPRPASGDPRLRLYTYTPGEIYNYTGHYTYSASILFPEGESIISVTMGNPGAWLTRPVGSRLYLKPIALEVNATKTNMMVTTSEDTYYFQIKGRHAVNHNDPEVIWEARFVKPDTGENADTVLNYRTAAAEGPDMSDPSRYNFSYTVSGAEYISPLRIFDDGEFTYLEYPKTNADLPAVFLVDSENKDALVNYHVAEQYLVVQRVGKRFTLRHGESVACIFNEAYGRHLPATHQSFPLKK